MRPRTVPSALLLLVTACASSETPARAPSPAPSPAAGAPAGAHRTTSPGSAATPWEYVLARYDTNGDGRVEPEEYDRDQFERLDRDADGALTAQDFEAGDRMGARMNRTRRTLVLVGLFQADADAEALTRTELDTAFDTYDQDGDGAVDPTEFEAESARRPELFRPGSDGMTAMLLRGLDPFEVLAESADANGDGRLAREELSEAFATLAGDDGDVRVPSMARGGNPRASEAASGVPVGATAPDFALRPPAGGAPVRLADFRGKRPVALVFGSYT